MSDDEVFISAFEIDGLIFDVTIEVELMLLRMYLGWTS